ncbi:MAG: hypothetical protein ABJB34_13615, partial [Acidobacteriota bacterium]
MADKNFGAEMFVYDTFFQNTSQLTLMKILLLAALLVVSSTNVFSAVRTWDGGGADTNWQTAANWSADVAPAANDDLVFPAVAAQFT